MWNNIKSSYILKAVFSFINEKSTLKIVIYNKKIQVSLDIDIINYKKLSGKYIVFDEKGEGKEYDSYTGQLIFKGKYCIKEKKKIGLEFKDNKIVFRGEIRNGKKWEGEGKEYDNCGREIYEGGFLNGERHGKGIITIYNEFDNKIFESECINGISNGRRKEYDSQGEIIFVGEYSNGQRNGKGKEYYCGELIFEGEYLNNKRNGFGKHYGRNNKVIFEGEYLYGKEWNGKVSYYNKMGIGFEGEYLNGQKIKGKEYYPNDKIIYEGEYLEGKRWNRFGVEIVNNQLIYEGLYYNGQRKKGKEFINGIFVQLILFDGEY